MVLYVRIALYYVYIDARKIAFSRFKYVVGFLKKSLNELARSAAGCVDCDHEFFYSSEFLVFQRLYQRHVLIEFQSVCVIYVIKLFIIYGHCLPVYGKLLQK